MIWGVFMNTLTWVSFNGRSVTFNDGGQFWFSRITDALGAEEQVIKAPGQDGATTYGVTLARPAIHLSASLTVNRAGDRFKSMDDAVDFLNRAFLPNTFGVLTEQRAGTDRMIICRPAARPVFGERIQNSRTVDIDFVADMPRWVEKAETVFELGKEVGGFRFPLRLPTRMGLYIKDAVIRNETGDEIKPVIEIFTTSEMIRVANETAGLFLKIEHPIRDGQKMVIDCADTSAWLYENHNGQWSRVLNVSDWLTHDSDYWSLVNGMNYITLRNERPDMTVIAMVRYHRPL